MNKDVSQHSLKIGHTSWLQCFSCYFAPCLQSMGAKSFAQMVRFFHLLFANCVHDVRSYFGTSKVFSPTSKVAEIATEILIFLETFKILGLLIKQMVF